MEKPHTKYRAGLFFYNLLTLQTEVFTQKLAMVQSDFTAELFNQFQQKLLRSAILLLIVSAFFQVGCEGFYVDTEPGVTAWGEIFFRCYILGWWRVSSPKPS